MHFDTQNRTTSLPGQAGTSFEAAKSVPTPPPLATEAHKHLFTRTDSRSSRETSDSRAKKTVTPAEIGNQGIFSANHFSPEFDRAYKTLQTALHSPENRYYENQLGWLSPATEEALRDLSVIVHSKASQNQAPASARVAFGISPLNPDEEAAWNGLVRQLPPVYNAYLPTCSPWREVRPAEVRAALSADSAMATMLATPEGQVFVDGLVKAMNEKSREMSPTDHGMAITLRFPECYGTTGHIALAGAWFDENQQLRLSFCHQESLIFPQADKPALGVVYDRFDTSADYPGHYAPVVETMKRAGPPSANVFPCPHPEAIVSATRQNAGLHNRRLYGPTYTWNEKQLTERLKKSGKTPEQIATEIERQKAEYDNKRPETCFNVTHKVLAAMYYAEPAEEQLLPELIRRIPGFSSIRPGEFDQLQGRSGNPVPLSDIPKLPYPDQVKAFLDVGRSWGTSMPWDVPAQSTSSMLTPPKRPGPLSWALPPGARAVKFIGSTAGLTLNGKPVQSSITYTVEEALQMIFNGKVDPGKNESFLAVCSASIQPQSNSRAKL